MALTNPGRAAQLMHPAPMHNSARRCKNNSAQADPGSSAPAELTMAWFSSIISSSVPTLRGVPRRSST